MRKSFLYCFILMIPTLGFGQLKYEKETRIKRESVPDKALAFIDNINFDKKIKWYLETGIDQTSIEAKTTFKKKKHSIEFNMDGVIEDIEVTIPWDNILPEIQTAIQSYFTTQFETFLINKIQIQYLGSEAVLHNVLSGENLTEKPIVNYEIILKVKTENTYKQFEYLFNENGENLKKAEIVMENMNNIEF